MKSLIIFIIEDNRLIRKLISQKLSGLYDLQVFEFENGDSVFDCLTQVTPDLVILDYHFSQPKLKYENGLSFLNALKKQCQAPVIALSGQGEKEVMSAIIENGAIDYISKDEADFLIDLQKSVGTILEYQNNGKEIKQTLFNANTKFMAFIIVLLIFLFITISLIG